MAFVALRPAVGDRVEIMKIVRIRDDGILEDVPSLTEINRGELSLPVFATNPSPLLIDIIPGTYRITWRSYIGTGEEPLGETTKDILLEKYSVIWLYLGSFRKDVEEPNTTNLSIKFTGFPYDYWIGDNPYKGGSVRIFFDGYGILYTEIDEWHTWDRVKEGWHEVYAELNSYDYTKRPKIDKTTTTQKVKVYIQCPPEPFTRIHFNTLTFNLTTMECIVTEGYPPSEETIQTKEYYLAHPYALEFLEGWQKDIFFKSLKYPTYINYGGHIYTAKSFEEEVYIMTFLGFVGGKTVDAYLSTASQEQLDAWKNGWVTLFMGKGMTDMLPVVDEFYNKYKKEHKVYNISITKVEVQ